MVIKMIIYHGSYMKIEKPNINDSRKNVDFGQGFYTTPIKEQAEAIKRLQYERPNIQICFRNQTTIEQCVTFIGSEEI